MPRDAFEGYDEPVNIDMDPEQVLKLLLQSNLAEDSVERGKD
ncbi:MAG TPA: hypothetical protein VNE42_02905 [Acidimicrobiales bacterium]|nr:hypothetical protein [Acidimicrobiales bacterium]